MSFTDKVVTDITKKPMTGIWQILYSGGCESLLSVQRVNSGGRLSGFQNTSVEGYVTTEVNRKDVGNGGRKKLPENGAIRSNIFRANPEYRIGEYSLVKLLPAAFETSSDAYLADIQPEYYRQKALNLAIKRKMESPQQAESFPYTWPPKISLALQSRNEASSVVCRGKEYHAFVVLQFYKCIIHPDITKEPEVTEATKSDTTAPLSLSYLGLAFEEKGVQYDQYASQDFHILKPGVDNPSSEDSIVYFQAPKAVLLLQTEVFLELASTIKLQEQLVDIDRFSYISSSIGNVPREYRTTYMVKADITPAQLNRQYRIALDVVKRALQHMYEILYGKDAPNPYNDYKSFWVLNSLAVEYQHVYDLEKIATWKEQKVIPFFQGVWYNTLMEWVLGITPIHLLWKNTPPGVEMTRLSLSLPTINIDSTKNSIY
jgi:hypothetical protein